MDRKHLNIFLQVKLSLLSTVRCWVDTFISLQVPYFENIFTTITKFASSIIYYVSMAQI